MKWTCTVLGIGSLLPLLLAGKVQSEQPRPLSQNAIRIPSGRILRVPVGELGEGGGQIFLSDFASPDQLRGLLLLKEGKQKEAATLFEEDMHADKTGVAAVGLAQATPPSQWPGQIKELLNQVGRTKNDIRLQYRLGILMYYDAIAPGVQSTDFAKFDQAAELMSDLWHRTRDPFAGLTLAQMAHYTHPGWKGPNQKAILEELVGVIGGTPASVAFANARRLHFNIAPPPARAVVEEKRYALSGLLIGLWASAGSTFAHLEKRGGKQVWIDNLGPPDRAREVNYLDRWIKTLRAR